MKLNKKYKMRAIFYINSFYPRLLLNPYVKHSTRRNNAREKRKKQILRKLLTQVKFMNRLNCFPFHEGNSPASKRRMLFNSPAILYVRREVSSLCLKHGRQTMGHSWNRVATRGTRDDEKYQTRPRLSGYRSACCNALIIALLITDHRSPRAA